MTCYVLRTNLSGILKSDTLTYNSTETVVFAREKQRNI